MTRSQYFHPGNGHSEPGIKPEVRPMFRVQWNERPDLIVRGVVVGIRDGGFVRVLRDAGSTVEKHVRDLLIVPGDRPPAGDVVTECMAMLDVAEKVGRLQQGQDPSLSTMVDKPDWGRRQG